MKIKNGKISFIISVIAIVILMASSFVYAISMDGKGESDIILGPISSEKDLVVIDEKNYALEALISILSPEDYVKVAGLISDYRKGDKDKIEDITKIVEKYISKDARRIVNYLIMDYNTKLVSRFAINHTTETLTFAPIEGFQMGNDEVITKQVQAMWKKIVNFVPYDVSQSIDCISVEMNKPKDNLITICSLDDLANKWEMNIDISFLLVNDDRKLCENLIYATIFYFVLRTDQVEFLAPKEGNYKFGLLTYKDDSYINLFYNKFWKGRRSEINADQYELYKKEFFNSKASRTVYDDMAVSFLNYVQNGYMRRYLGFKADKNNFFNDIPFFKQLAKGFRTEINIINNNMK